MLNTLSVSFTFLSILVLRAMSRSAICLCVSLYLSSHSSANFRASSTSSCSTQFMTEIYRNEVMKMFLKTFKLFKRHLFNHFRHLATLFLHKFDGLECLDRNLRCLRCLRLGSWRHGTLRHAVRRRLRRVSNVAGGVLALADQSEKKKFVLKLAFEGY